MKQILLLIFTISFIYGATDSNESNRSAEKNISNPLVDNITLKNLNKTLTKLDSDIDNEWTKTYSAFITHKNLLKREEELEEHIKKYKSLRSLTNNRKTD